MMKPKKAIFNWSGGKDSALALYHALQDKNVEIVKLVTTVNQEYQRISMHGVRQELLTAQGKAIGLPIEPIFLPLQPTMAEYDAIMHEKLTQFKEEGITHSIFGDIFLEDLKQYREEKLAQVGLQGHFPIWKRDTKELIAEFLNLKFKTVLVCIKAEVLSASFAGRVIDKTFVHDLPNNVDPCGENGEFHTFVFDGPIFKAPINIEMGELVFKEYKAPKNKEDSCFSSNPSSKMGFYFKDIKLKK